MATQIEHAACQILADNLNWLALPEARQYVQRIVSDTNFADDPDAWYDTVIDHAWTPADHSVARNRAALYRGLTEAYAMLAAAVASYRRHGRPVEAVSADRQGLSLVSSLADEVARCHSMVTSAYAHELPSSEPAASHCCWSPVGCRTSM